MFPNGKLLQQKPQTWPHTRQVGGLARPAVMPGSRAALPGTARTWRCRTQTQCTLTTRLPEWLSRCPLQLGPAHPVAASFSAQDAQLCPGLLHPTLSAAVSTSTECSRVWLFSFSCRSNLSVVRSCTTPDARGDSVKAAKPHRGLCSGAWLPSILLKLDASAGGQLGFSVYFWPFLTYN